METSSRRIESVMGSNAIVKADVPSQSAQIKPPKRRKVAKACLFCKRSHMTCDDCRPCQRCIKREIGHLCCDGPPPSGPSAVPPTTTATAISFSPGLPSNGPGLAFSAGAAQLQRIVTLPSAVQDSRSNVPDSTPSQALGGSQGSSSVHPSPSVPFLSSIRKAVLVNDHTSPQPPPNLSINRSDIHPAISALSSPSLAHLTTFNLFSGHSNLNHLSPSDFLPNNPSISNDSLLDFLAQSPQILNQDFDSTDQLEKSSLDLDQFFESYPSLFVDPDSPGETDGSTKPSNPDNIKQEDDDHHSISNTPDGLLSEPTVSTEGRLDKIIREKKVTPFDYPQAEQFMMNWVEQTASEAQKLKLTNLLCQSRILLSSITSQQTMKDLLDSEYQFQKHCIECVALLDTLPVPGCIWRRTGEIEKGNPQFEELIGFTPESVNMSEPVGPEGMVALRHFKVYQIWDEESNVNYWEKFNRIALDQSQKAVLTSCVLLKLNRKSPTLLSKQTCKRRDDKPHSKCQDPDYVFDDFEDESECEPRTINCTFSFTVKRDSFGLPSLIVGNFLPS